MPHVADVASSIRFYERLGFTRIDTEGDAGHIGWARLHYEGGALMLLEAESAPSTRPVLQLYMNTDDLAGLRDELIAQGVAVSAIARPPYMRSGEARVEDPDGNVVFLGHWGRAEHAAWEERLAQKRKASGR